MLKAPDRKLERWNDEDKCESTRLGFRLDLSEDFVS